MKLETFVVDPIVVALDTNASEPLGVKKATPAFAFRVAASVLGPVIQPGSILWVHPDEAVVAGNLVLLAPVDEDKDRRRLLRVLVLESEADWTVEQSNPPKQETFSKSEWPKCMKIAHIEI
jgi:hypothetical protein